tara:strand:- start:126329 stop:126454 length:126 start_codon:yes stop_codon:yes gene_type:complete
VLGAEFIVVEVNVYVVNGRFFDIGILKKLILAIHISTKRSK